VLLIGLEKNLREHSSPVIIHIGNVPELNTIETKEKSVVVGGAITVGQLHATLKHKVAELPASQSRIFKSATDLVALFAGVQIRNMVGVASTIATGRATSDLSTLLLAAGAELTVASKGGQRHVKMADGFFHVNRKTALKADDIIVSISIPYTSEVTIVIVPLFYVYLIKLNARRKEQIGVFETVCRMSTSLLTSKCVAKLMTRPF
jgi:xanthine dehydrogenase iron-sulfur cluster and FAD-binding subunit A